MIASAYTNAMKDPSRFACCVDADRPECVLTRQWVGVSFGGLDGGVVSLMSLWWVSGGYHEVHTCVARRIGLE